MQSRHIYPLHFALFLRTGGQDGTKGKNHQNSVTPKTCNHVVCNWLLVLRKTPTASSSGGKGSIPAGS